MRERVAVLAVHLHEPLICHSQLDYGYLSDRSVACDNRSHFEVLEDLAAVRVRTPLSVGLQGVVPTYGGGRLGGEEVTSRRAWAWVRRSRTARGRLPMRATPTEQMSYSGNPVSYRAKPRRDGTVPNRRAARRARRPGVVGCAGRRQARGRRRQASFRRFVARRLGGQGSRDLVRETR